MDRREITEWFRWIEQASDEQLLTTHAALRQEAESADDDTFHDIRWRAKQITEEVHARVALRKLKQG